MNRHSTGKIRYKDSRGKRKIGTSKSDMAMLTVKKLKGFLRVFVLKTIIAMKVFPTNETRKSKQ